MFSGSDLDEYRRRWDESELLRKIMRALLQDWGASQWGGLPNLGYPTVNILGQRDSVSETEWADWVQSINDQMTLMMLEANHAGKWTRLNIRRMVAVTQCRWARRGTIKHHAKQLKISQRHFHRLHDECVFRLWVLFQMDPRNSRMIESILFAAEQHI